MFNSTMGLNAVMGAGVIGMQKLKEKNILTVSVGQSKTTGGVLASIFYASEIIIFEKKPIAVQILGNIKFYISEKGEKLNFFKNEFYEDLPIIFGNQKNFSSFFSEIKQSDLPSNQIKAFYYFDIGRWDIVLKNKKIIKLPEKDYMEILVKINSILNDKNFSKYRIFDYRIKDQLILE